LRKFPDNHGYASDLIEQIRPRHEQREEHEVEGQKDYFLEAGFKPAPKSYPSRASYIFVVNPTFHLVAAPSR
jgi:hypothetical protein